jgi:hypothetical protein
VSRTRITGTAGLLVSLILGLAGAQPEPWVHPDGSIHYYHALSAPAGIRWPAARALSQDSGGYLATLTSQAENDFVFGLVDSSSYWYQRPGSGLWAGPWLGGNQPSGSPEPDSGWRWVTTEPFGFRHWSPGEPDNGGAENSLHFGESVGGRVSTWDDLAEGDSSVRGLVRELSADSTTIGLLQYDSTPFPGYTLFAPLLYNRTYLVDNKGRCVHSWRASYRPGMSVYLLENGNLLRAAHVGNTVFRGGGSGGRVEEFDWAGNVVWSFDYSTDLYCQHHDIELLPNGNVLLVAWELKTRAEAVAAGRNPNLLQHNALWPAHIIEVERTTNSIVWEWHVWDHLIQDFDSTKANYGVVAEHPELVDINFLPPDQPYGPADWCHTNSVDYSEQYDQIVLSAREFGEVWVIDHSTTTEQARGHSGGRQDMGGDILYRWGNPRAYRAGDSTDQRFFGQHDAHWVQAGLQGAGHLLVFNNGTGRLAGPYSTVDELIPPCDSTGAYLRPAPGTPFGPAAQSWIYRADPPESFFSEVYSGAQRLANGNTLACLGRRGVFVEVTPDTHVVWRYGNPVVLTGPMYQADSPDNLNIMVFRATRYPPDYPGLAGRDLTPKYPIERYRTPSSGVREYGIHRAAGSGISANPNPCGATARIRFNLPRAAAAELGIYSMDGRLIRALPATGEEVIWDGADNAGNPVGRGVYCCRLQGPGFSTSSKLVKTE